MDKWTLGIESTAHTLSFGLVDSNGNPHPSCSDTVSPDEGGIHPRQAADHHKEVAATLLENLLIQNPWQLRPNPANESVAIDWSGEIRAVEIRLYDNLGRFIKSMDVSGLEIPSFSVAALDAGLYYVTIQTAGGASATRKLMVE